jgi:hypothetical protein
LIASSIAMKISQTALVFVLVAGTAQAYQASSRRAFVQSAAALVAASPLVAQAIEACPSGTQNCIRTTWTPPAGTSAADMAKTVSAVLTEYPSEGQADADKGGWTIVQDDLAGAGTAVEFKSGIGNFAKYFNGGKPFVDDLKLEIANGVVEVRSSSRVGESDFKVNQKRLLYLGKSLQAKGWEVPGPTY